MQWSIVDWMLMNSVPLYRILLPCSAYGYWSHRPLWYLSRPETVWMLLLAFVESHKTETDDRGRHRKTLDAVQCTKTIEWIPALPLVFDYIWVIAAHKTHWWYVETGMEGCWVCRCSVVAVAAGTKYNGIANEDISSECNRRHRMETFPGGTKIWRMRTWMTKCESVSLSYYRMEYRPRPVWSLRLLYNKRTNKTERFDYCTLIDQ